VSPELRLAMPVLFTTIMQIDNFIENSMVDEEKSIVILKGIIWS